MNRNVTGNADICWVKLLKRKYPLNAAQKFLISITMTCFATVSTEKNILCGTKEKGAQRQAVSRRVMSH